MLVLRPSSILSLSTVSSTPRGKTLSLGSHCLKHKHSQAVAAPQGLRPSLDPANRSSKVKGQAEWRAQPPRNRQGQQACRVKPCPWPLLLPASLPAFNRDMGDSTSLATGHQGLHQGHHTAQTPSGLRHPFPQLLECCVVSSFVSLKLSSYYGSCPPKAMPKPRIRRHLVTAGLRAQRLPKSQRLS